MLSLVRRSKLLGRTSRRKMSTKQFIDYFGAQVGADKYAAARPIYPPSFLDTIVAKCPQKPKTIIDIGCGTGQATFHLATHADITIGMDPSEGQIKEAEAQAAKLGEVAEKIRFVQGGAEDLTVSGIAPAHVDLITAAQCAHWFDLPVFYEQAKAALSPQGVLALWCYTRPMIANCPDAEDALRIVYSETLGPHWPPSRKIIDNKYVDINPPMKRVERIEDKMEYELDKEGIIAYLGTWSSLQVAKKLDPSRDWLKEFREALEKQPHDQRYHMVTPIYGVIAYQS